MCEINISKYYFGIIDMKTIKSKEMDMLNGGLVGKLILFSLPLAFSSILQQLFNSADVAVVGRFAGDNALAAVGSCVALVGIFVNLIVGLAVGPNAVLANLIGQKQRDKINDMVHTILTFGTILGLGLMILGFASARIILELSGTPSGVLAEALLYIRIYFLSIPFMTVYNFGAAILRSFGDTRRPMFYLIISGIVNVILNLILVICFHLGVAGVAISTVISNVISAVMVMVYLYRRDDEFAFRFNRMKIVRSYLRKILQIGIPSGIQGTIFSISNVFIQSGINSFGKFAIAGSSLALNFEYFTYDIANAFAQATVTFTSQNYGAGNIKRCKKVFWLNMLFGIGFTNLMLQQNLLRKVIGFNIMDSAVFLLLASLGYIDGGVAPIVGDRGFDPLYINPIPSGLVLTGIVVSVSITAFSLALIQRIYRRYGTIEMRELLERAKKEDD